jgi:hypothetical protein
MEAQGQNLSDPARRRTDADASLLLTDGDTPG